MGLLKRDQSIDELRKENERLTRTLYELSTLNELAQVINSTTPLNKIMDTIVAKSVKAVDAQQGTIHLVDEKTQLGDPFRTYIRKADETDPTTKFRLDFELSGWMMHNRQPLLVNDFENNSKFVTRKAGDLKIKSLLSVPLIYKSRLIGILTLFNKKVTNTFTEDDQRLLSIVASQSSQVMENARLYEQEKQLLKIEKALETARAIQTRLLPKESPAIQGFDISGFSNPAKEVGGDYFDYIDVGKDRWCITLGDVSGKGIPAALIMTHLQATMRYHAVSTKDITECIALANNFLNHNTESRRFVTLFGGILDIKEKSFEYVNAGHNYPVHMKKDGSFEELKIGGLVMGMVKDAPYESEAIGLAPGDVVLIYSDGISEAENAKEELFEESRIVEVMQKNLSKGAKDIAAAVHQAAMDFAGDVEQADDMTVVAIKVI